jgi:uracil-DNA glycosylase
MPDRFADDLAQKLADRLRFYEDLGIRIFYRDRSSRPSTAASGPPSIGNQEDTSLPKPISKPAKSWVPAQPVLPRKLPPIPVRTAPSLFESADRVAGDTLFKIREDLGDCTRCKLHKWRHTIVFGQGNAKAELVFVGEGPGADEDAQGLAFVGRAGKLLTQMIEAMGLKREDVYICNIVKCRPPENRTPEKDEINTCSPFLFRQLEAIDPKVIVCLGSVAAQTLLETNRGISHFRGEWLEYHGRKLLATYHPAYLLRNPSAKTEVWKDLQKVMAELGLEARRNKRY